eukprot:3976198-Pyramimonas_sp.AAC.1
MQDSKGSSQTKKEPLRANANMYTSVTTVYDALGFSAGVPGSLTPGSGVCSCDAGRVGVCSSTIFESACGGSSSSSILH